MLWRLLPLALLASCAANEPGNNVADDGGGGQSIRVIGDFELKRASTSGFNDPPADTKVFQWGDSSGRIQNTGSWHITSTVHHTRLLCATYEVGIQLGQGNSACSQVGWLTDVKYGTRRTQCNSATLIHTGGGEIDQMGRIFDNATCARVVVRCEGVC